MNPHEQLIKWTRATLNDYAARNKLLGNVVEYTDEDILSAVDEAVDEINHGDVYQTNYSVDQLIAMNPYLLRLGVAKVALFGKMIEKSRNSLQYNDGAGYVDKEGNLGAYQNMYSQIQKKYDDLRVIYKASLNVMHAMN